jgi:anti-anti-sigma factor
MTRESFELTVSSDLANLETITDFVTKAAQRAAFDEKDIFAVQMAVDEACTNIITHAYAGGPGDIHLTCQVKTGECTITIRDYGRSFDPDSVPLPDLTGDLEERRVGGLGLHFMRKLMDKLHFSFDPVEGNQVVMVKRSSRAEQTEVEKTFAIVAPQGRVDAVAAPDLETKLEALLEQGDVRIVVDMAQVSYISSSGLKVLLATLRQARQQQGQLILCDLQPRVAAIFEMAGFDQVFSIEQDLEAATRLLG